MINHINYVLIFAVCAVIGLVGCISASSKEVRFVCDNSVETTDLENQIIDVAEAHKFPLIVHPQKGDLTFRGYLQSAHPKKETYLYIKIGQTRPTKVSLMVVQGRAPGGEDILPPEVLDVFNSIVSEVNTRFINSCVLQPD